MVFHIAAALQRVPRPRWVRAWMSLAAVLGLALLALVAGTSPSARAAGLGGQGNGQIDGDVLNGTRSGAPIANQAVALRVHIGAGEQQVATTTTDAQGNFHFRDLPTDQQDIYLVTVDYQGATYTSDAISLAGEPHPPAITVLAYDATASDAQIGIGRVTLLIDKPNVTSGTIRVAEVLTVINAGTQTFVGQPVQSGGMPTGLLRFALPAGYRNLLPQDGFGPGQIIQVNRGFAATTPVQPGETQLAFSFVYPYDGTASSLTYEAVYPTAQVVMLAPPGLTASVADAKSQGTMNLSGGAMQVWEGGPLPRGKTVTMAMRGLPVPGEKPNFDPIWLDVVAALLALVAFGAVLYYLMGHHVSWLSTGQNASAAPIPEAAGTEEKLYSALAHLDAEHAAGAMDDVAYRLQRAAIKSELKTQIQMRGSAGVRGAT